MRKGVNRETEYSGRGRGGGQKQTDQPTHRHADVQRV